MTDLLLWLFVIDLGIAFGAGLYEQRMIVPSRHWWLGAAVISLVERIGTFAYFIPTALKLMRTENNPDSAAAASQWMRLNLLRAALGLAAWLAALKSLSLLAA